MTTMKNERRYPLKNMAFKCTYNDGGVEENGIGFTKTCSDALIQQHIKAKRAWCSNSGCPCRNFYDGKISRDEREESYDSGMHACYERKMLIDWKAQAGTHHPNECTEGIRLKIRNASTNSLAILTTRPPGYSEKERVIFAVFIIDDFYVYMAFQKGTQTAPHRGTVPPQAGMETAGNRNPQCAGRRLTVVSHGGTMISLLLMYRTGQRWRATRAVYEVLRESDAVRYHSFFCFLRKSVSHGHHSPGKPMR